MKKSLTLIFPVLITVLCACSHTVGQIDSLSIRNQTNSIALNVKLNDTESGGVVSCSTILPYSECSVGFSAIENEDHEAILSWVQNGREYRKSLPKDKTPAMHPDYPNRAILTILDNGRLNLELD